MILNKTTIVLVRPQLPENIGMVARTMDNFGNLIKCHNKTIFEEFIEKYEEEEKKR